MKFAKLRNVLGLLVIASAAAMAQSSSETANQAPPITTTADLPEISTQEQAPSFQVKVNLVEVRVVVRDAQGKAIGNLKQDDFVLLDDKKPQQIKRFSVEESEAIAGPNGAAAVATTGTPETVAGNEIRQQFAKTWRLAYLFDDVNSTPNDLTNARKAADQAIDALAPGEQLGIFTLSGQGQQDFSNDKDRLRAAVAQLKPRPQGASVVSDCPPINYYIADQITNLSIQRTSREARGRGSVYTGDSGGGGDAFKIVLEQVIACQFDGINPVNGGTGQIDQLKLAEMERAAYSAIDRVYRAGEAQSDFIFQSINQILRHVSQFGGQRTLVFLSPGFYIGMTRQPDLTESLNRAVAQGVVINTLDLRGVQAPTTVGADISQKAYASYTYGADLIRQQAEASLAQSDTLLQISNTTGGKNFRNSNDFNRGLANLSALPEVSYLLGFNPQGLKSDGKFHTLNVQLKQPSAYSVQARKGYYAPRAGGSTEETEREVAEAVFAHDEIHELPVRVQTQFFRSGDDSAKVLVLVHVDVRRMQFKKANGRNLNDLTVIAALFDRNANLVMAKSSTVKMHIKDATLDTKLNSGINVKSDFDVKPGSYLVRVVARDEQGKLLTQNEVVDIP